MRHPQPLGSLLLAFALCLTMLSCGQRESPPPAAAPNPATAPSEAPTAAKPAPPPEAPAASTSAEAAPPRHLHHAGPDRNPASIGEPAAAAPPTRIPIQQASASEPAPTTEDQLADTLAHLPKGNLVYNPPTQMKSDQTLTITALIGSDQVSLSTLQAAMPQQPAQPTQSALTPITPQMKVTLTSADFTITLLSSDSQIVAGPTPTTWEWQIAPKHSGQLSLHLAAVIELNGLQKDFTTVDRQIAVQVDPINAFTTFLQANWQWLIVTIFIPLIGALWKLRSNRKKQQLGDA